MSGSSGTLPGEDRYSDMMLAVATPDLYRTNSFRVLGLPVDSTPADLARQQKRLVLMQKLGTGGGQIAQGYLPLGSAPGSEAIRRATQRIQNPEARLIDEFFWFWPLKRQAQDSHLLPSDPWPTNIADAVGKWSDLLDSSSCGHIAIHNLAIYHHAMALDLDAPAVDKTAKSDAKTTHSQHWLRAFEYWREVTVDEGLWRHVVARIREIDDPRLTAGAARHLRHTLPEAILGISADLAMRAAQAGSTPEARNHLAYMRSSGFDSAVVAARLEREIWPLLDQIKRVCEPLPAKAKTDPDHVDEAIQRVIVDTRSSIGVVDTVLDEEDPLRQTAHDTVARVVRECAVIFGNKTENWERCLQLVTQVQDLAVEDALRALLQEDISVLENRCREEQDRRNLSKAVSGSHTYDVTVASDQIIVPAACTCCMKDADCQQTVSHTWQTGSVKRTRSFDFPVCRECLQHSSEYSKKVGLLIWVPPIISTGVVIYGVWTIDDIDWPWLVLAGAALTTILFLIIGSRIRLSVLGEDHASRDVAVSMPSASSEHTTFRFDNPLYAHAFAKSNDVQAIPRQSMKPPRGRRILGTKRVGLWIIGAVVLAAR